MKNRPSTDPILLAEFILGETTAEPGVPAVPMPEKNPAAVAMARHGGLKGGRARAEQLSPQKRSVIARKAAAVRWKKER
jgi:hypothetical protein